MLSLQSIKNFTPLEKPLPFTPPIAVEGKNRVAKEEESK